MTKYVNVDELLNRLPDDLPYKESVKRVLIQAPTADVVPKSEVDILKSTITRKEDEAYNKGYNDALKDVEKMIKNTSEREK